jgi:hypothetical protein
MEPVIKTTVDKKSMTKHRLGEPRRFKIQIPFESEPEPDSTGCCRRNGRRRTAERPAEAAWAGSYGLEYLLA